MGFASFLKVDLKQIPGKFSKWIVDSFDPYSTSFVLPNGQRFTIIAFDAYMTLGMSIGEREIIESSKSSPDEEYDEMHAAWELHHILGELLFHGPKNRYYSKSILKYVKDVNQITSLDWCKFVVLKLISNVRHYKDNRVSAISEHQNAAMKEAAAELRTASIIRDSH
ncbi:hypothetical protein Cgig2_031336 [Carnegiea gigantea]|uniref:Uncharacterized protein n=1 Tax=Carnegiea gigantea TaxID=171969 RepID=A0A9Q1GN18_9CARY|nr:hypothetical protein Cgig2_031336 [Carnegiea gigantea]